LFAGREKGGERRLRRGGSSLALRHWRGGETETMREGVGEEGEGVVVMEVAQRREIN
jgi:hypothetical protein